MQRFPSTMCPDPFHHAHSFDEQLLTGVEIVNRLGDWEAVGYGCRTCGFQHMRRITETWIDKVKSVCPGCDAIHLRWEDEVGYRCGDCRLRDVRVVRFNCEPNEDVDRLFPEYPNLDWSWAEVIEYMR
jgi:hypothetical protein